MMELLVKGGWVMIPILLSSIVAITIFIERSIRFYMINRSDPYGTIEEALQLFKKNDIDGALSICKERRNPIVDIIITWLEHYGEETVDIEGAVSIAGSRSIQSLQRNVRGLGIIANITPLLGLFGTILGIIKAFMRIEEIGGRVDVAVLAGGIWEALLTTAFGLAVAIPSLLMYYYLDSRVDGYILLMKALSRDLSRLIKEREGINLNDRI